MGHPRNRRRSRALAVLLGVPLVVGGHEAFARDSAEPPSRAEAEAVLDEAVRLARSGDHLGLCRFLAAADATCRNLLQSARNMGREPGQTRPEVVGVRRTARQTVLHLRGVLADGSGFTSDFGVIRDHRGLRAGTPVYWAGVTIAG
ncbi:hypothetical protein AB0A74_08100 [Saccharothrix sp. NPDC042600]|uniref:hypothetical protein n=1 Tax=Saccharothrix TaxID=2071 RepID=UPI0033C18B9E|nr:hypothetical protein GCM10017745_79500 [Saccharothrix mutabilis subsp. capreolus]